MRRKVSPSLVAALGLLIGNAALAQSKVPATGAASVYEFIPGARSTLYVINDFSTSPGHAFDSYIYFDLSAMAGSSVNSAVLRLRTDAGTAAGFMAGFGAPIPASSGFTITDANSSWFGPAGTPNSSLSWATRPLSGTGFLSPQTFNFVSNGAGGYDDYWLEIDVTSLVNSWLGSTATNYGFRLSNLGESVFSAAAFNGTSAGAFAPQLVLTSVPEPSSWGWGIGGALLLLALSRKRQSRQARCW